MAKKMMKVAQARPNEDLKLKVVAEVAPTPTDDEETYSGPVFKRRRKPATEPSEHYVSDGRAPSPQAPPPSPPPSHDMVVVQEDEDRSALEGRLWDPSLDALSFLENTLLSVKAKEKLESLEEDQLVEQAVRQLRQAMAATCLAISKLRGWKGSAKEESHKVVKLLQQVWERVRSRCKRGKPSLTMLQIHTWRALKTSLLKPQESTLRLTSPNLV